MEIEVIPTPDKTQSIFVLRMPEDTKHRPTVSQLLPTRIAQFLKVAAENAYNSGITPDNFAPELPKGYRLLQNGEMMQPDDIYWAHPGEWKTLGDKDLEPWTPSFRPMARLIE
jgi:hypothetical protein